MGWLYELTHNVVLMSGCSAWVVAQVIKFFIHAAIYKTFRMERLFGDGGMPSAHSATVTSMAVATAITEGVGTFQFAIAAMLAVIVMHDAMGVRRETGKQSVVLNEIIEMFNSMQIDGNWSDEKLKEFVGHTPLQVAAGFIVGAIVGCVMGFVVFAA